MGAAAAKRGDRIVATDVHNVDLPDGKPAPPASLPFSGPLADGLSTRVKIEGEPAATVGSTAENTPKHVPPPPPGSSFPIPPTNLGTILAGSPRVRIEGRAAARDGDTAETCSDLPPAVPGKVVATGKVRFG